MEYKVEIYGKIRTILGEGPVWDEKNQQLCQVDVVKPSVILGDEERIIPDEIFNREKPPVNHQIGAMFFDEKGDYYTAMGSGIYRRGDTNLLKRQANGRFNDGKVGPDGWFYGGTNADDALTRRGSFYSFSPDMELKELFGDIEMSNGLDWSMDYKRMYYTDTGLNRIDVFDFDKDSHTLSNRRTLCKIYMAYGITDGMTIDTDDNLWVAMWNGGVLKIDGRTGEILKNIKLPTEKVSSCCFGGKKYDELYITTGSFGADAQLNKAAGYTYVMKTSETGRAPFIFGQSV